MEKGYYIEVKEVREGKDPLSQSTIKMEKGYYTLSSKTINTNCPLSQSTIKMEKGYYRTLYNQAVLVVEVAIHNKNGKGLLQGTEKFKGKVNPGVAIHNKNGKGLLRY